MAGSNKRERQLAREKYQRQQARRAQQRARRKQRQQILASAIAVVAVLALVGGVVLALHGSRKNKSSSAAAPGSSPSASSSASSAVLPVAGCTKGTATPKAKAPSFKAPALTIAKTTYTATLATNCGSIVLSLDGAKAPQTVNSFVFLAGKGYFNGTSCHRLTTTGIYVLQCGDPTATGSGGPGYTLPEENLPTAVKGVNYPAGTVAMARTQQKHSGGSQFFLVYKDTTLNADYTIFGKITKGLDILTRVAGAGSDNSNNQGDGKPNQAVVLQKVTVTKAGS